MNKYLEKIAELHIFEEGVIYNDQTHDLKISPKYMNNHLNKKDNLSRVLSGGLLGAAGGILGYDTADRHINKRLWNEVRTQVPLKNIINGKTLVTSDMLTGKYGRLVKRFGMKPLAGAGAAVGALGLGSVGYLMGGLTPMDKSMMKDQEIIRLERKYNDKIDEIEGW